MRLADLLSIRVRSLSGSICMEYQRVTWSKVYFSNFATPVFKQSHHGAGRTQPLHVRRLRDVCLRASADAPEEWGKMSAIRVAELAACVVFFRERRQGQGGGGA